MSSTILPFVPHAFALYRFPRLHRRTMSFPSGHTTSATFLVASLVFVLLPVLLHKSDPDTRGWAYQVMQKMQVCMLISMTRCRQWWGAP